VLGHPETLNTGPLLLRQLSPASDETLHKLWWSHCKHFTSRHTITGMVLGVEASIHVGDELWFGVGMEVSERDQNLAINRGEMDQEPIWNQTAIERPHLHRMCSKLL